MSMKIDPSITSLIPRSGLGDDPAADAERSQQKRGYMRAMEKPQMLATPGDAGTRPTPGRGPTASLAPFQREAAKLLAALRGPPGPALQSAAEQAVALAASYSMRRSKGARRSGLDLLEAVAAAEDTGEDLHAVAVELRNVLLAEAYLHQADPEATLRAVRALIAMLDAPDEVEPAPARSPR